MTGGHRGPDVHRLLTRTLHDRAGGSARSAIVAASSEAWSSATFRGARHRLSIDLAGTDAGDRAARLAGDLEAAEIKLPGHLLADIAMTARRETGAGVTVDIEALTVEDA